MNSQLMLALNCLPVKNEAHCETDASKLTEFMSCPRKFFFHYILGWQTDSANNHLVFGTAWHEAMEHLLLNGYAAEEVSTAFEKFLLSYRTEFSELTDDDYSPKSPAMAMKALKAYVKTYAKDVNEIKALYTEIGFRASLSKEFTMCGRIDAIIQNGIGTYPLDHKTGSRAGLTWTKQFDLGMQTGLYTHAAALKYGFDKILGTKYNGVFFYKSGEVKFERVPCWRSAVQQKTWLQTTLGWLRQMRREYETLATESDSQAVMLSFPMRGTNCTNYGVCQYHDFCNLWGNPLQHVARPPAGFVRRFWSPFDRAVKTSLEV